MLTASGLMDRCGRDSFVIPAEEPGSPWAAILCMGRFRVSASLRPE